MTNFTACFHSILPPDGLKRLNDECAIMVGVAPCNIEHHDDLTHFTLTTQVNEDETTAEEFFNEIASDLSRWIGSAVYLDEIFVDD
jgi:hypothetical protein